MLFNYNVYIINYTILQSLKTNKGIIMISDLNKTEKCNIIVVEIVDHLQTYCGPAVEKHCSKQCRI